MPSIIAEATLRIIALSGAIFGAAGFFFAFATLTRWQQQGGRDGGWLDDPARKARWRMAAYVGLGLLTVGFSMVAVAATAGEQWGVDVLFLDLTHLFGA